MLLDKIKMTRHWIRSPHTLLMLDFSYDNVNRDYEDTNDYNKYQDGADIIIEEFEKRNASSIGMLDGDKFGVIMGGKRTEYIFKNKKEDTKCV